MARERLYWIPAGGTAIDLTDLEHLFALRSRQGFWSAEYELQEATIPQQPGAYVKATKTAVRTVDVPVVIKDSTEAGLRTRIRDLASALNANKGVGTLRAVDTAGVERDLYCRYMSGLGAGTERPGSLETVLTFRASDPYWYSHTAIEVTVSTGATTAVWFPIFPLLLNNSAIYGTATVVNPGDEIAWPIWTITGPGSDPELENITTGKILTLDVTLVAGEEIEIDTRPGYKTITKSDGTNLMGLMSDASSLWSLAIGSNTLAFNFGGADAASNIQGQFNARYLSA